MSLNGKPVTDGVVMFVSEADPSMRVPGQVFGDGKYTAMSVPVGPVKVYFDMSEPKKWEEAKAKTQAKGLRSGPRPPIGGPSAVPPAPTSRSRRGTSRPKRPSCATRSNPGSRRSTSSCDETRRHAVVVRLESTPRFARDVLESH